jgi:hypothetical protein
VTKPLTVALVSDQHAKTGHDATVVVRLGFAGRLVAPKATKREAQLAEQRHQTAGQTARLDSLETECAAWGVRGETWRQTERLSPIEQTLTVQPISPATALALPSDWRVCSPSRAQVMTNRR